MKLKQNNLNTTLGLLVKQERVPWLLVSKMIWIKFLLSNPNLILLSMNNAVNMTSVTCFFPSSITTRQSSKLNINLLSLQSVPTLPQDKVQINLEFYGEAVLQKENGGAVSIVV